MFYYLDGTVAEVLPYLAVIDCGGVGYACKTTNNTLSSLKKGQHGRLYTYLNVGEGVFDLYGFATQAERNSFKMLIWRFRRWAQGCPGNFVGWDAGHAGDGHYHGR